ncbi:carbonic anhydrase 4b [Scomber japonicus]|uniref:carbonic anhydrase 4b n=1 Tax=Scomber japonicus TaxID=13676 RepID=UPI0023063D0F|nr:carbonic anhydrase 4b [Scomber japonicus]
MLLTSVLFLCASAVKIVSGADWCYQSQVTCSNRTCSGPDSWGGVSPPCDGRSQSPVNIVTRRLIRDERLTPFQFTGYQETFHGRLLNNGHSLQLDLPSSIQITGGNLATTYKAVQLHIHWGKDGGPGSEHTIDGEQFPMEMHIVHIKEEYDSLSQAVRDPSGVAVLGFLFEESSSANKKFDPLINALKSITQPTNFTTLEGVFLDMFIPAQKNLSKYFRYDGSLTTPDCSEAVVWTLFTSTVQLSREQLAAFNELQFSDGKPMAKTYRPVQPLNGRKIYYSAGYAAVVSAVLLISSVLVSTVGALS